MKPSRPTLRFDAGYFIHPCIFLVLALLSVNHLLVLPLAFADLIFLWTRFRRLFGFALVLGGVALASLFFRVWRAETLPRVSPVSGMVLDAGIDEFFLETGEGTILVHTDGILPRPGDSVTITGAFYEPSGYRIEHRFEYGRYLASEGVDAVLYAETVEVTSHRFHLNQIKTLVTGYLLAAFPGTERGLVMYLLLGTPEYLTEKTIADVQTLGISHLFSISGMNIALMVGFLDRLLKGLYPQKRLKEGVIIGILGLYCLVTGFSVPIVRAVLVVLGVYLRDWGRLPFSKLDLMSFVLAGFLIFNPFGLSSLGFQLSFLIAFAIVIGTEVLKTDGALKAILKTGLFANLVALPILLETNQEFNLLSIPANVFFVLFVEWLLLPGTFLTVFIPPFAPLYRICADWFSSGASFLAKFEATIQFNFSSDGSKIMYFLLIFGFLLRVETKKPFWTNATALVALIAWNLAFSAVPGVTFVKTFDVGQGDAIYLHAPDADILIDTGDVDDFDTLIRYFRGENIDHLDLVILTHSDSDHVGELVDLLNAVDVGKIIAATPLPSEIPGTAILAFKGDFITCGSLSFEVLSANRGGDGDNGDSLVLSGIIGCHEWLFLGDAEAETEAELLEEFDLNPDVVKVGHHGSDTSSLAAFVQAMSPLAAIVSVGENNVYGHPADRVLDCWKAVGSEVYRTDDLGTITFSYFPGWDHCLVTKDDREDPFNNEIKRFGRIL